MSSVVPSAFVSTTGGRKRPLYCDAWAREYAPQFSRASISPGFVFASGKQPMIGKTAVAFDIEINVAAVAERAGKFVGRGMLFTGTLG
jgi:hypothetical protein